MGEYLKDKTRYKCMEKQVQNRDTESYLFKNNDFVESSYFMTINEHRLIYLASKKLKQKYIHSDVKPTMLLSEHAPKALRTVKVYVTEFRKAFDLTTHNLYETLRRTAELLNKRNIKHLQKNGYVIKQNFIERCKYKGIDNCIEIEFAPTLMLDLLALKGRFGVLEYNIVKYFTSAYAFRLYELLKGYLYRKTRTIELHELRIKMGILDDKKHEKYAEFKRDVLKRAVDCINEYSNLIVEFDGIRYGRRVGAVIFSIYEKSSFKNYDMYDVDAVDKSQIEMMREMTGYVFSTSQIAELTNTAIEAIRNHKINMSFYEYIQFEVNMVRAYANLIEIDDYYSYLKTALQSHWTKGTIDNSKQLMYEVKNTEPQNIQLSFLFP